MSEMLKVNTTLTSLNLSSERRGKGKTKRNKKINDWLTDNGIRDEGAKALCEKLKVNKTLTSLVLRGEPQ